MAASSLIEWTDATWPIVQGCDPVSQGCVHCYAVPLLWRLMHNPNPKISGPLQGVVEKHVNAGGKTILRFTGKVALREDRLRWPLDWKDPKKIFVPSHGDPFHDEVPAVFLVLVFIVMALCPQHTFQVLTKRPERMRGFINFLMALMRSISSEEIHRQVFRATASHKGADEIRDLLSKPLPNVWLGISAEDQPTLEERWPHLEATPAARRFLSYEPALGPIQPWHIKGHDGRYIDALVGEHWFPGTGSISSQTRGGKPKLDWIIAGGESGANARPAQPQWFRELRNVCADRGTAFFFKQWGAHGPMMDDPKGDPRGDKMVNVGKKAAGALLDGREHREFPR